MDKRWPDRRMKAEWMNRDWFNEREDLMEQGDPDTVVFLPNGALLALSVYNAPDQHTLGIREEPQGKPESLFEITDELVIDAFIRSQSNPRRHPTYDDEA